jgi:hypothetical protein
VSTHHSSYEFPLPKSVAITEHPARMRVLSESAGADESKDLNPSITPVFPADPKRAPVTPVESALPKLLDLKSFRIRTYGKKIGERGLLVN